MRNFFLTSVAALMVTASAHATTVSITQPPEGSYMGFNPYVGESDFTVLGLGTFTGANAVYAAGTSIPGVVAATGPGDAFMGVLAGQDETLDLFHPTNNFSIYWGSASANNNMEFVNTLTHQAYFIMGETLESVNGVGAYSVSLTNLPFSFNEVQFHDLQSNAFEFSLPGATGSAPEPSTWAMILLGFAGLSFAGFKRSRTQRLAVAID